MDGDTLRTRVVQLIQRTRKAVRLYSSAERLTDGAHAEYTALQLDQWQQINTELQRQLTAAAERPNLKHLAAELLTIRDRFYHEWRNAEAEVHLKQGELLSVGEKGDFVRAALISRNLVVLKSREQAAQAAHHELQDLVDRARLDPRGAAADAAGEQSSAADRPKSQPILLEDVEESVRVANDARPAVEPQRAKVIPLRSRKSS